MKIESGLVVVVSVFLTAVLVGCGGDDGVSDDLSVGVDTSVGDDIMVNEVAGGDAIDATAGEDRGVDTVADMFEDQGTSQPDTVLDIGGQQDIPADDGTNCVAGEPCDDGDPCTVDDKCSTGGIVCAGALVPACDDGLSCTVDSCATAEECSHPMIPGYCLVDGVCYRDGAKNPNTPCQTCVVAVTVDSFSADDSLTCDDFDDCTLNDHCDGGVCVVDRVECDDGNPCTQEICSVGECMYEVLDGELCDDGNPCTADDVCTMDVCAGTESVCDDDNVCTDEFCDPTTPDGCVFTNNQLGCDDGNTCTTGDVCAEGVCAGTAGDDCACDGDEDCIAYDDGNLCNGTVRCLDLVCVVDPATVVICEDDANTCTAVVCDPTSGTCSSAVLADATPCDDGDACTVGAKCVQGLCTASGNSRNCDDFNVCTDDSCDSALGCVNAPNTLACDDGESCTTGDTCVEGRCVPGTNTCQCAIDGDCVVYEDSNACNGTLSCVGGVCVVEQDTIVVCPDTGNICTKMICQRSDGKCMVAPDNNGVACDDNEPCTQSDVCDGGVCVGSTTSCDDDNVCTDDRCEPGLGCMHDNNTAECDDSNICSLGDTCSGGRCNAGSDMLDCDDGNPCTTHSCVPAKGCIQMPNSELCDDGNACTVGDFCKNMLCQPGVTELPCDDLNICTDNACDPDIGCVYPPNNASCDDEEPCHLNDVCEDGRCMPGFDELDCEDGNVCTHDFCVDGVGCDHEDNMLPCDDADVCTYPDICSEGDCVGTDRPDYCDDGYVCTKDTCDPEDGCANTPLNTVECRPLLIIDYPPRGATLNGLPTVTVLGHVENNLDGWAVPTVTINGETVLVNGQDGTFQFDILSGQGMNPIVADTADIVEGLTDRVVQTYYYATEWFPTNVDVPSQSMITEGLLLFLGPEVWDDNDTSDYDDIATIIGAYLANMDMMSMIENPVEEGYDGWACGDHKINIDDITFSTPAVDLVPQNGGLYMFVSIPNFRADISGKYCHIRLSGNATASSVTVTSNLNISLDALGNPVITLSGTQANVSGLNVDIDGIAGFLANWLVDFFEGGFEDQLEDMVKDQIDALVPALQDALAGLALNESFDVPALLPGGVDTTVSLVSALSRIDFTPAGGEIGMKATIVAPQGTTHDVLGSIGRSVCLMGQAEPDLNMPIGTWGPAPPLELALHDDLVNQITYALFWAGALKFPVDMTELGVELGDYNITDMVMNIDMLLPPILTACNDAEKLMIQIGDLGIDAEMKLFGTPLKMQIYASLEAGATLTPVDGDSGKEIGIAIEQPTFLDLEIETLEGGLAGAEDTLMALVRDVLIPQVMESLTGNSLGSFPLPEIDLSSLLEGVPAGSNITLEIQQILRFHAYNVASGRVK